MVHQRLNWYLVSSRPHARRWARAERKRLPDVAAHRRVRPGEGGRIHDSDRFTAAARIAGERLRPVGLLELRGFLAPVPAASPWPEAASAEWRARYLEAYARRGEAAEAGREFAALAAEIDDPVARRLAGG